MRERLVQQHAARLQQAAEQPQTRPVQVVRADDGVEPLGCKGPPPAFQVLLQQAHACTLQRRQCRRIAVDRQDAEPQVSGEPGVPPAATGEVEYPAPGTRARQPARHPRRRGGRCGVRRRRDGVQGAGAGHVGIDQRMRPTSSWRLGEQGIDQQILRAAARPQARMVGRRGHARAGPRTARRRTTAAGSARAGLRPGAARGAAWPSG